MDYFVRLIRLSLWFVVGVLFSAWAVLAHADTVPQTGTYRAGSFTGNTPIAAATAYCDAYNANNGYSTLAFVSPDNTTGGCGTSQTNWYFSFSINLISTSCPSNSSGPDASGLCTCASGYVASNGQCVVPPCQAGETQSSGYYDMGISPTAMPQHTGCDGGCTTSFNGTFPVARALVGGVYHYFGEGSFIKDGSTCSSGSGSPSSFNGPPSPTCDVGQTMGQVNGQTVCLGSGGTPSNPNVAPTSSTTTSSPPVTNPDGSTTETTTQTNADGSTTTTSTVIAPDGTKTTTSQTVNADGTPQDPMKGFCQMNPSSPMCKGQDAFCQSNPNSVICKEHTFSGSCASTTCSGDAIECQIAQEQAKRNCVLYDTATPLSDLGNQVASGSDPQASAIANTLTPAPTDVLSIFTSAQGSRWLGSADLPDYTIMAMGGSYVIPMSNWSNLFRVMGYILVSVSLVIAVRMVSSTVTA